MLCQLLTVLWLILCSKLKFPDPPCGWLSRWSSLPWWAGWQSESLPKWIWFLYHFLLMRRTLLYLLQLVVSSDSAAQRSELCSTLWFQLVAIQWDMHSHRCLCYKGDHSFNKVNSKSPQLRITWNYSWFVINFINCTDQLKKDLVYVEIHYFYAFSFFFFSYAIHHL